MTMIDIHEQIVIEKIGAIKKNKSEEYMRSELFSVLPYVILDTKLFKRNSDIKEFLIKCDDSFLEYKDYLFASRTVLLSKIIRSLIKAEKFLIYNMVLEIKKLIENERIENSSTDTIKKNHTSIRKRKNYTDELFNQFERGE